MLMVSAGIGVYYALFGSKKVSTDEFLMGGRTLSAFPVALSILASFMSAITLLGTASEVYLAGTQYVLICVSYCFVIPATAYFYMPIFHHLQLTSAYEGGMKAVVWTDVFQIALMFGSMIVVVLRGTIDLGGLGYVFDKAQEGGTSGIFQVRNAQ
ncbi:hypothetical protein MTO96_048582 [Rhipicephalus appendiculatus]